MSDQNSAVEAVMQFAERRHREVLVSNDSVGEENHRREVEQLVGPAATILNERTVEATYAQEAYKRESLRSNTEVANYVAAQEAAESQRAEATQTDMQRLDYLQKEEVKRLLTALEVAKETLAKNG